MFALRSCNAGMLSARNAPLNVKIGYLRTQLLCASLSARRR